MVTHASTWISVSFCATCVGTLTGVVDGSAFETAAGANTTEPAVGMRAMVGVEMAGAVGSGVHDITFRALAVWSTSFHAADMVSSG